MLAKRATLSACVQCCLLVMLAAFMTSCGSPDYRIFSLKEGIARFSMEYPPGYVVTRMDIRNDASTRYTDVGLTASDTRTDHLNEIAVYAWPAAAVGGDAVEILDTMLGRASTIFQDFKEMERYSVMIGDMEGQAAVFSWTAAPTGTSSDAAGEPAGATLQAISRIVSFRHGDLAWEIHIASNADGEAAARSGFEHILETFRIFN